MRQKAISQKRRHPGAVVMTVLLTCLLCLFFAACERQPVPPAAVSDAAGPVTARTAQPTAAPDASELRPGLVTPAASAQASSPSAKPTATPEALPTATPSPRPTHTPAPQPAKTPAPLPTPTPKPTPVPTPEPTPHEDTVGDSNALNASFYWIRLDDSLKQRITGISYPADDPDCQIHYDDLRYIRLLHYDFSGEVHEGELIVHATLADEVMEIFHQLYLAEYPLTSVRLVDDYGQPADDTLSMEANNTSAFNYRYVTGTRTLSRHSFGAAIDVNPMLNPYIDGDRIAPENGAPYADRTWDFPGKIDHDDLCYQLFIARGWTWGGDWSGDKDYQHFSKKINP